MLRRLFGSPTLFLTNDGGRVPGRWGLLDQPEDTLIKDSHKSIREKLAQIPEGKTGTLVIATDWKWGFVPTVRAGLAHRTANGWEIAGDAFISKADKGASIKAVKSW